MKCLIVARTQMKGANRCIGAVALPGRSLRLLGRGGKAFTTSSPFQVNEVWELTVEARDEVVPPHVEDVLVLELQRLKAVRSARVRDFLLKRPGVWRGGVSDVFDGLLGTTGAGNCYVSEAKGLPSGSTGFWVPKRDLKLREDGRHYDYIAHGLGGFAYVGERTAVPVLQAGTLIRVSLARWWKPPEAEDFEERCYAQISGWWD